MGMDYYYAGSSSYPRFNDEVKSIVELFDGKMVSDRKPQEECTVVEYFMEKPLSYSFPETVPPEFIKWANDPYEDLTVGETKTIFEFMKPKWDKVKELSHQIALEFESLVEWDEGWEIH